MYFNIRFGTDSIVVTESMLNALWADHSIIPFTDISPALPTQLDALGYQFEAAGKEFLEAMHAAN